MFCKSKTKRRKKVFSLTLGHTFKHLKLTFYLIKER